MGESLMAIDPDLMNSLPPELFKAIQQQARQAAGTDVDETVDRVVGMLGTSDPEKIARNQELHDLTVEGQTRFSFKTTELKPTMRLLDLMWLGALVHNHFDELFPDPNKKESTE